MSALGHKQTFASQKPMSALRPIATAIWLTSCAAKLMLAPKQVNGSGRPRPMSALGHKRTYAPQQATSALHPIATTKADMYQWSCLLYPRSGHVRRNQRCLLWANSRHSRPP